MEPIINPPKKKKQDEYFRLMELTDLVQNRISIINTSLTLNPDGLWLIIRSHILTCFGHGFVSSWESEELALGTKH